MPPSTVSDPAYYTAAMSYHEWKREPTIPQILFGLDCPYGKPSSPIARFLWRRRLWIEVTFALSMMEPWERFIVMYTMYAILLLLATAGFLYLPHHLSFLHARASYYLFGSDAAGAADSLIRLKDAASWGLNASLENVSALGSSLLSRGAGAAGEL